MGPVAALAARAESTILREKMPLWFQILPAAEIHLCHRVLGGNHDFARAAPSQHSPVFISA